MSGCLRSLFVRSRSYRCQRNFPGWYWVSTCAELVGYEFWHDLAKHGYAADRIERRLDLIAPNQPDARRRYGYREAALFPDIVETTKLLASRFWLRKALNG